MKGRYQEVNPLLQDEAGNIYGGLVGEICWNWLEVQYLFVEEAYWTFGYGKQLLSAAEQMAKEK
ncbi:GNAT family N-acetyltransferase [Paenibacillus tritici]|uniref:GNAT family N-acetyltransferase n=1 Tax=Paenibacillus tritici TaxID=1873425 RepID=UPI001FE64EF5|nr:GNAT family N-acetyltransferase [Paenibacillus tritici]